MLSSHLAFVPSKPLARCTPLAIVVLLLGTIGCGSSASPTPAPPPPQVPEEVVQVSPDPSPRVVKLDDGSYVELSPGVEPGFAHCCGDEQYRIEIACSDGLLRCYQKKGKRWNQTYGKHCKAELDRECYERTCVRVCEAYWELGPTLWREVIPD